MLKRAIQLIAVAGAVSACGAAATPSNSPASSSSAAAGPAADIHVGSTSLGQVLTNQGGRTLYYFLPEKGSTLVCDTGACLATWPFLTVSGTPSAQGVTGQLTQVSAPGGQSVVVFNGWPLHTYSGDSGAGQTNGQGIEGKWFAATPSLTAAGSAGSSSAPASASSTYNPY
jgi:predicted lipoprotein with Yx(FWY)xxD motif